jgi:hypothetical protein
VLSVIVESSIVEFVSTTLLPVPLLNSESVITTLLATESSISPFVKTEVSMVDLVSTTLLPVPSLN